MTPSFSRVCANLVAIACGRFPAVACRRLLAIAAACICCCSSQSAGAQQNYIVQHLTADDGLMSGPRVTVYQDKEGYYWFASVNGLQRYDGKNFVTYNFSYSGKLPVRGDWTSSPVEDKKGNIWVTNQEGVCIFNRITRSFSRLYLSDAADSFISNVSGILKDKLDQIYIITVGNIFRFDEAAQKLVLVMHVLPGTHSGLFAPHYDSARDGFWILVFDSTKRIGFIDLKKKTFTWPVRQTADQLLGHNNPISCFYLDRSGNLWLTNFLGDVCQYNTWTNKADSLPLLHHRTKQKTGSPNSAIQCILDDGSGNVWIGGDYYLGLLGYDQRTHNFFSEWQDNGSEYGLHYTEDIYSLYTDREGNIWVCSDLGFNIFNPGRQMFHHLRMGPSINRNQFSADVTSIYQSSSGDIWIGTWGDGIFRYDSNFNLVNTYLHDNDNPSSLGEPLNKVWCFSEDKNGRLWVGCQYAMLSILNISQGKFTNTRVPEFQRRTIMHVAKDSNDNMWFGLFGYLTGEWLAASSKMILYGSVKEQPLAQLSGVGGIVIDSLRNSILWPNGADGLQKAGVRHPLTADVAALPKNASSLCAANDSTLVGDIPGKGIFVYTAGSTTIHYYNAPSGSPLHTIYGALPDGPSAFWIIANDGIDRLNIRTRVVSTTSIADGITDREFEGPYCRLRNGTILLAGKSGVVWFDPRSVKTRPPPPDVRITDLREDQDRVTIEYASLSFEGRKSTNYFYQLEGLDKDWVAAGSSRSVTYANLAPGHYTFKVKSRNADGTEALHLTTVPIYIRPPWWRSWWAITLWILLAVLISFAFIYYRKQNLAHLSRVRQKIASDLHDDIGSTLNSISVYSEVAALQFEANPGNAKQLLYKMGGASRQMIETMNDIVWAINPQNDQFENVIQRMQYFAGELLSGKDILLRFDVDATAKSIKLPMEKRKNIYLIFKEAINNAYKYSHASTVSVSIAARANHLIMTISDDGSGFIPSGPATQGNGLENMKFRSKEIRAHLHITSGPKHGASIELKVPLK